MWDLIVSVPDHCLSFYFTNNHPFSKLEATLSLSKMSKSPIMPIITIFYVLLPRFHW